MVFLQTLFLLLLVTFGHSLHHHLHPSHSLLTDKAALLEFRKTIVSDPFSSLANWVEAVPVCNFTGVECDRSHNRVIRLILYDKALVGLLSPVLSNLTGLHNLEIVRSHLFGIIPREFSNLRRIHSIIIEGNNLHGSIPDSFSMLSKLNILVIKENNISGSLPSSLFSNCTLLNVVDFSSNSLSGQIPEEIGNCKILWSISLYNNQFTGQLPLSLTNLSLQHLDVEYNYLSGELPAKFVSNWPYLLYLHLSYNNMVSHDSNTNLDPFFTALRNNSNLEELELAGMGLGGRFTDTLPSQLNNLRTLLLQENQIFGSIPRGLASLSRLFILNLTSNLLNGTVSSDIFRLPRLEQLFLSHNHFKIPIPEAIGECLNLGLLDLSHNQFSGRIPDSLGDLVRLNSLFLNNNLLSGTIPPTLGRCSNLYRLDLSHNRLTGSIPLKLAGLREIRIFINVSHNHLEGDLPIELSKLEKVQEIDLSSNYLTGSIFPQISGCIAVSMINFSNNFLQGEIPQSLGDLRNLESFDVSRNQLSGLIPAKLGNPKLCGTIEGISLCSQRRRWIHGRLLLTILILVILVSTLLSIICCVIGCKHLKAIISSQRTEASKNAGRAELISNFPRITYKELSDATGGFDNQRLVGSGSYGHVYRGVLADGTPIAVKVLHLQSGNSTKSFNRECQVLKRIRHRNLIRIITACSLPDFKALVLPYMANGSLESRLYPSSGSSELSIVQRVNICSDIAEGMAYLHHHSPVRVIHCDLKPSNCLLNDDMTALVSDFGVARLLMSAGVGATDNMCNSSANLLFGSIGYIAPEYGFGSNSSVKGDVYSFGILVLEMVTRRRPIDELFVGGLSLQKWVKVHFHGRVEKVVDPALVRASRDESQEVRKMWEVAISELIELGLLCTQESPSTRPTMLDAADDLDRLKRYLNGDTAATFASSLGISSSTIAGDC
ncbi:putative leucine-rich repeat receptor-like serine/threonine-protein kinase At2g24130 isoform X2 [Vigna unguiculata]|uniref:putative leucine-rich repeat receptor-like serine/threonine-protein kinase At2g24130 isoform X2 n=1 Tax=Vigna unguiculata TaxID=3917 RepID=UPI0010162DDD|nr:putative leucine-rich repeat receptor-like serine/threonine-protein kinase At2g24130 isoform X2 [Vigna unguiculata]